MKLFVLNAVFFVLTLGTTFGQSQSDLFGKSDVKISWMGIDYTQVKLIGDFSAFAGAGNRNVSELRDTYFPGWNKLIVNEPDKYDVKGMLRKPNMIYDLDLIMAINSEAAVEEMEAYDTPNYSKEEIQDFVKKYNLKKKEGIGIVLIAESMNKIKQEAFYHFVAFNMKNGKVILHERMRGEPGGFGVRNYWAASYREVINQIQKRKYSIWKSKFKAGK